MSRPHRHQWPEALRGALELIKAANIDDQPWRFTGGSALATLYDHRYSRDADLFFVEPIDILRTESLLQERFGYSTKATADYSLKVFLPHGSHVDLVNVKPLTQLPVLPFEFENRMIDREHPAEILAKKIRFRGGEATPRDIFDYATVIDRASDDWPNAAIASGYGGMAKLLEILREGKEDFVAIAPTEIATATPFDPAEIWKRVESAAHSVMPAVLWADTVRQYANRPANWREEWYLRAIQRAGELDPAAERLIDALKGLDALGECSIATGLSAAADAIQNNGSDLMRGRVKSLVQELGLQAPGAVRPI